MLPETFYGRVGLIFNRWLEIFKKGKTWQESGREKGEGGGGGGGTLICHQPDNSNLFKVHELAFPGGGGLMNWATVGSGLALLGNNAQRWVSSNMWEHHGY